MRFVWNVELVLVLMVVGVFFFNSVHAFRFAKNYINNFFASIFRGIAFFKCEAKDYFGSNGWGVA